jgi:hypothetical protein
LWSLKLSNLYQITPIYIRKTVNCSKLRPHFTNFILLEIKKYQEYVVKIKNYKLSHYSILSAPVNCTSRFQRSALFNIHLQTLDMLFRATLRYLLKYSLNLCACNIRNFGHRNLASPPLWSSGQEFLATYKSRDPGFDSRRYHIF